MTIVGGRTATENPRYGGGLPNVDAVVCGDGEQRSPRSPRAARGPKSPGWSTAPGRSIEFNPPRENVPLDDDLMPARDLRRHPYYLTSKGVSTGIKVDQVAGSRGCPFHCKFCNFRSTPGA